MGQLIQGPDGIPLMPEGLYNVPSATDREYTGGIVYIDPSLTENGNGSIEHPYNTWTGVELKPNTAYLQRRGTKAGGELIINTSAERILIGAYGEGSRPDLNLNPDHKFVFMGHYSVLRDVKVGQALRLGKYNNSKENIWIYNCEFDLQNKGGICIVNWGSNNKIVGNHLHHSLSDGIFCQDVDRGGIGNEIAYNYIHDVNMNYINDPSEKGSPGDVIQISSGTQVHIHHNILDHSSTGNKFGIIVRDENDYYGDTPMEIIIEHNIIFLPKPGSNGCAGIYLQEKQKSIVRYNQIIGREVDDDNAGIVVRSSGTDIEIYGNLMVKIAQDINTSEPVKVYNNTFVDIKNGDVHNWENVYNNILSKKTDGLHTSNIFIDIEGAENLFNNPFNADYTLKNNSPAVDAGKDVGLNNDLLGIPIPQNSSPDIGAYEYTTNSIGGSEVNQRPVADAGADKTVNSGTIVTLDASKSFDPDNDVLSSFWTAPTGITLSSANAIKPIFTALSTEQNTSYIFTLKVFDGHVYSLPDTVIITVNQEQMEEAQPLEIKKVEASTHDGNVPKNTIDESLSTRWSAQGEGENITYELSGMDEVRYLQASFYKGDSRKAFFEVQISNDQVNWVKIEENLESAGVTEGFQNFDIANVDAKYVRIVGYGNSENDWNSINEIKIYGIPEALKAGTTTKKELKAYPNPTAGNINLDLRDISFNQGAIHVYNMAGALVYKKENILPYQATEEINLEEKPNGIYIVKFNSDRNTEYISKIILQSPNY